MYQVSSRVCHRRQDVTRQACEQQSYQNTCGDLESWIDSAQPLHQRKLLLVLLSQAPNCARKL
jgi:hypothetical protein